MWDSVMWASTVPSCLCSTHYPLQFHSAEEVIVHLYLFIIYCTYCILVIQSMFRKSSIWTTNVFRWNKGWISCKQFVSAIKIMDLLIALGAMMSPSVCTPSCRGHCVKHKQSFRAKRSQSSITSWGSAHWSYMGQPYTRFPSYLVFLSHTTSLSLLCECMIYWKVLGGVTHNVSVHNLDWNKSTSALLVSVLSFSELTISRWNTGVSSYTKFLLFWKFSSSNKERIMILEIILNCTHTLLFDGFCF